MITDRDVVSPEEMESDPFYRFPGSHGLKYFAAATMVSPSPRVEVALSVQRSIHKSAYSETELDLVTRLGPHVERSLRLGIRLMDTELSKLGLGAALARVGIGVFILDSKNRVIFSNPVSHSLLGGGLDVVDDKLVIGSAAVNLQASDAMKRITNYRADDLLAGDRHIRPSPLFKPTTDSVSAADPSCRIRHGSIHDSSAADNSGD